MPRWLDAADALALIYSAAVLGFGLGWWARGEARLLSEWWRDRRSFRDRRKA